MITILNFTTMKTKTNEEIFENVRENGYITEKEIKLLKNRSNNERRDVLNYELLDEICDGYGVPVTPEQGAKGLRWLRGLLKSNGEPRKGQGAVCRHYAQRPGV